MSLGLRHGITLLGFLCCFLQNAHNFVFGVGIVAMVKRKEIEESSNWNESEISCPLPSSLPKHIDGSNFQGEFDWSSELRGYLLAIGSLSMFLTQIPAGRLADAIGSKFILVSSYAALGTLTLILPFAARWHVYALMTVEFLRGLMKGFIMPSKLKMISNWIPRHERGTLSTLMMSGLPIGAAVSGAVTGWLCDIPGLGWPSAFYVCGIISVMFSVIYYFIYYEHPENHPWISDEELKYIVDGLETKLSTKKPSTPWKKMFSSVPTYAYIYGYLGHIWSVSYFHTVHPTFVGTILHYPMTKNGIFSCLPFLFKSVGGVLASVISYWISKKKLISLDKLRKIMTAVGSFGFSLCMAGVLLAGCNATINILCFALSLFTSGMALSGIMISGVDMAPAFAGSLTGVASTFAGISVVLLPIITGLLTENETLSEWQIVFCINIGVVGSCGLVYVLFGSAEVQAWNYPEDEHSAEDTAQETKKADININQDIEMNEKLQMTAN